MSSNQFQLPPPPPPPPRAQAPGTSQGDFRSPRGRGIQSRGHRGSGTFNRGRGGSRAGGGSFSGGQKSYGSFRQPLRQPLQEPLHSTPAISTEQWQVQRNVSTNPSRLMAAPAVPSFNLLLTQGTTPEILRYSSLQHSQPQALQDSSLTEPVAKKRRINTLGLTPKLDENDQIKSEDEGLDEGLDEEAGAPQSVACASLIIRHGTETFDLSDPAQLQAWKEERRKRFPTKARIAEREAQAQRERDERSEEAPSFANEGKGNKGRATNANKTKLGNRRVRLDSCPEKSSGPDKLNMSRKTLSKPSSTRSLKSSHGIVDLDDETSSSGSSASDSDSGSASKVGSDSSPEETKTRERSLPDPSSKNTSTKLVPCHSFSKRSGKCKCESECKYLHERSGLGSIESGANGAGRLSKEKSRRGGSSVRRSRRSGLAGVPGRVSLRQRLIDQEKEEEGTAEERAQ